MNSAKATLSQTRDNLERLLMIIRRSPEGICLIDRRHVVEFANPAWARMHGYISAAELIGQPLQLFHTRDQMKRHVYPFLEMIELIGRFDKRVPRRRTNRSEFTADMTGFLLLDEDGAVTGYVLYAREPARRNRRRSDGESRPARKTRRTTIRPDAAAPAQPHVENTMNPSNDHNSNVPDVIFSEYESVPAIAKILGVFTDSLPGMLADMRSALEGSDSIMLTSLAHQLKGSGGGYGYPILTTVAAQLEQAAADDDWEIAGALVAKLESLCAAVIRGRQTAPGEPS
jgi:PAS domain S-box-containing protein